MGTFLRAVGCVMLLVAAACAPEPREYVHTFTGETMGTTYTVKVASREMTAANRKAIETSIDDVLARIDRIMSTWRSDSELSRFNDSASTEPVKVSSELIDVLDCARQVSEMSDGAFDVTVGPLVDLWGFGPKGMPERVPTEEEIATAKESVGYKKLELDLAAGTIRKTVPGLRVDVGAIAPGYGSDQIADALTKLGYKNHMVELGGEVRAGGHKLDGSQWRIAIERPDAEGRQVYTAVTIQDESLSTSGDYRDYFEKDGVRYSHTINPALGRPIQHNLASVSVIRKDCIWADAWATALDVLGPDAGLKLAEEKTIAALFLVRKAPGAFVERESPEWASRRKAQEPPDPEKQQLQGIYAD